MALRVGQATPELPEPCKESEVRRKANDEECIRVFTVFVATYLLLNGKERLSNPRASQLENIQGSVLETKSNRLALKKEEEVEDQVYSPKPVQLEKYRLPADDLNSPKHDHPLYLADYAYSEVPPNENPSRSF
ncbi:MAG TPA: hypothetical protein VER26_20265 [Xanthobacteraceae bacterium]|nr:hypothetical protein [Xanthobacteraceae bacterium]